MPEEVKVTFSANDQLSKPIDNINRGLNQIDKAGQAASIGTKRASLSMTDLWSAVNLVQTGLTYLKKGYDATIGATINYANQVRQLSSLSGESTESTSRFIQVLDDYKISAEDALLATKALTKNGHAPSIETLAKLSDEYLALNSVEDRNALILKNLGKGGLQWVEVLEKGSKALTEQGEAVNEGLILSEHAVKQAREYELALDDWNDSVMALKISIGNHLIPRLNDFSSAVDRGTLAVQLAKDAGENYYLLSIKGKQAYHDMAQVIIEGTSSTESATTALRDNTFATKDATAATQENEEAIKAVSEANQNFVSVLGGVVSENQTYNKTMQELRVTQNEFIAEKAKLISQGYGAESSAIQDVNGKLAENEGKMAENKAAHKAWTDAKIGDLLLQQLSLEGLEKKELAYYLSYMTTTGQMTKADAEMTQKIISDAESIGEAYDEQGNAVYHVGERSLDAADKMVSLTESQAELAASIRKNALPTASALARALSSIPAEVRSYVELTINTIRMNSGPVGSGGLGGLNIGSGLGANAGLVVRHAKGGRITDGAIHVVGDSPSGGMTPYTEAIYNGEVFNAKETRKMYEAGMLDGATRLASGSGEQLTSYRSATSSRSGSTTKRRSSSGSRGTIDKFYSGGAGGSSGGSLAEEAAVTAAEVAEEATTVAASSLVAAESISNNVQQGSQASVAATVSTSGEIIAAIQETNHLLRRLDRTTHDNQYEQQLNI